MKINLYAFSLSVLLVSAGSVQAGDPPYVCGSDAAWAHQRQKDAGFEQRMAFLDNAIDAYLKKNPNPRPQAVITIPVVFHVVYSTSSQNIADACLQSQVTALTRDFRKQNTDITNAPSQFQAVAADCEFQFCLATKDPQGNPTNGIIRKQTSTSSWTTDDAIKYASSGGSDTWGATNYLNIWVGNLGGGLGGYAYFPCSVSDDIDGVVIHYATTGLPGSGCNPSSSYNKGRVAVHEVGHWLGLYHTFQNGCAGTSSTNCSTQGDRVCDTPPTAQANINNTSCTQQNTCTETPTDEIDMIQNQMDYTLDGCKVIYTAGQKSRMISAFNQCRSSLANAAATKCSSSTGIWDLSQTGSISVYPMPASDHVTIDAGDDALQSLILMDASGRKVDDVSIPAGSGPYQYRLGHLSDGIYFIQVKTNNGIHSRKISVRKP